MSSAQGEDGASATTRLGRILLVDDQAQNRDMLGRRLERRGYDVVLRETAVGIEDVIAAENIELVLLDWMMPERSGLDALQGIRRRFDAEHVPVIVVTALDDGDIVSKALEGGSNDYITKPIDLRVLTARVKAQLDRRQAVLELDAIRDSLEKTVQAAHARSDERQRDALGRDWRARSCRSARAIARAPRSADRPCQSPPLPRRAGAAYWRLSAKKTTRLR